jgi:hypothetical protein
MHQHLLPEVHALTSPGNIPSLLLLGGPAACNERVAQGSGIHFTVSHSLLAPVCESCSSAQPLGVCPLLQLHAAANCRTLWLRSQQRVTSHGSHRHKSCNNVHEPTCDPTSPPSPHEQDDVFLFFGALLLLQASGLPDLAKLSPANTGNGLPRRALTQEDYSQYLRYCPDCASKCKSCAACTSGKSSAHGVGSTRNIGVFCVKGVLLCEGLFMHVLQPCNSSSKAHASCSAGIFFEKFGVLLLLGFATS